MPLNSVFIHATCSSVVLATHSVLNWMTPEEWLPMVASSCFSRALGFPTIANIQAQGIFLSVMSEMGKMSGSLLCCQENGSVLARRTPCHSVVKFKASKTPDSLMLKQHVLALEDPGRHG